MTTYAVAKNAAGSSFIVSNRARGSSGAWITNLSNYVGTSSRLFLLPDGISNLLLPDGISRFILAGGSVLIFGSRVSVTSLDGKTFHTVPNRIFYV